MAPPRGDRRSDQRRTTIDREHHTGAELLLHAVHVRQGGVGDRPDASHRKVLRRSDLIAAQTSVAPPSTVSTTPVPNSCSMQYTYAKAVSVTDPMRPTGRFCDDQI